MLSTASPYLLLCLTSLFWSFNFILGKILSGVIPPASLTFLRWILPFFFFIIYYRKDLSESLVLIRKHPLLILLLGATGYSLNSIAVFEAVRFTTTINTSFINAFNPVLIAATGYLMYRFPVTRVQGLGFLISLIGVLAIVFKGDISHFRELQVNIGDLFMVGSISLWSIQTVVYKHNSHNFISRAIFPLMMLAGLTVTLPLAIYEGVRDNWAWIPGLQAHHLLAVLALNIFPSVLAYLFWNQALTKISANQVAIFQYLIPVYTTCISLLFLHEPFRLFHVAGGTMIFIGVLLVSQFSPGKPRSAEK